MPAPHQLFPLMEGALATIPTNAQQYVQRWLEDAKREMLAEANRDLTTWEFRFLTDIDEDGHSEINTAPFTTANRIFGLLVGTVSTAAELDWVAVLDADTHTFDGTAALNNSIVAVVQLPAATATVTEQWIGAIYPGGLGLATGLGISADGVDGANPGVNDNRGWALFTTA